MKKVARRVQQVKRSIFDADHIVVYHGDCLKVMASMPEASVDTIVTDPPYELGFMSKKWDSSGIAFDPETWCAALRVVKPGAHLVAFGGTRTFHRIACAIEDAGWEMRDCLMWVYGSGFPKSLDVSKAIDKAKGAKRAKKPGGKGPAYQRRIGNTRPWMSDPDHEIDGDDPVTPEAARWQGWGTGLKPSWEPIILARKPLDGTVAECVLRHGTGALNVDATRIGWKSKADRDTQKGLAGYKGVEGKPSRSLSGGVDGSLNVVTEKQMLGHDAGRWPPNAIFQHDARCVLVGAETVRGVQRAAGHNKFHPGDGITDDGYEKGEGRVYRPDIEQEVYACVPGCPVRMLDGQSGQSSPSSRKGNKHGRQEQPGRMFKGISKRKSFGVGHNDSGGASRFFYTPKASTAERVLGCPPGYENRHPTVKPLDLCRWLCRLTKGPDGGVVLDPFSGSGSIAVAALLEGRSAIAIELEEESANATVARVQAALKYGEGLQRLKRYKLKGRKKTKRRR